MEASDAPMVCKVFWDYENCSKPKDISFEKAFISIRNQFERLNIIISGFNVYCDEALLGTEGRQTLQDLGCTVINPSKRIGMKMKPETVDLRLAVDAAMFAMERYHISRKTWIVLISSDTDFGHLLGQLRNKSFQICLLYNKQVSDRLSVHAHHLIRLFDIYSPAGESTPDSHSSSAPFVLPATATIHQEDSPGSVTKTHSIEDTFPVVRTLKSNVHRIAEVDDELDNMSLLSMESEQTELRVSDLVDLVRQLLKEKGLTRVADATVCQRFTQLYPALKPLYREIRTEAEKRKEIKTVKDPTAPQMYLCIH